MEQQPRNPFPAANLADTESFECFGTASALVECGAASNPGRVRANNEDHYAIVRRTRSREILLTNVDMKGVELPTDEAYVMIVADGVGGRGYGELASELVLRIGWDLANNQPTWFMKYDPSRWPQVRERVEWYVQLIQKTLRDYARSHPKMAEMGTTWTCAYTMEKDAIIAHLGDSRAYIYRDAALKQLTRDQTFAQQLKDLGMPNEQTSPFKHILTNSFSGNAEFVESQVEHFRLADGDRVLLCTDGLTDMLSDAEIAETLRKVSAPQAACDALIELALANGGKDNVTVVIADYRFADPPAAE